MSDPVWVAQDVVLAIHDEQLAEHGGRSGTRDLGALQSALERPRNRFAYGGHDTVELAAAYGFALARSHPFQDGNKRTSFVVTELFLSLHGMVLMASDGEIVSAWLRLAAGEMNEEQLVRWLRDRSAPR